MHSNVEFVNEICKFVFSFGRSLDFFMEAKNLLFIGG